MFVLVLQAQGSTSNAELFCNSNTGTVLLLFYFGLVFCWLFFYRMVYYTTSISATVFYWFMGLYAYMRLCVGLCAHETTHELCMRLYVFTFHNMVLLFLLKTYISTIYRLKIVIKHFILKIHPAKIPKKSYINYYVKTIHNRNSSLRNLSHKNISFKIYIATIYLFKNYTIKICISKIYPAKIPKISIKNGCLMSIIFVVKNIYFIIHKNVDKYLNKNIAKFFDKCFNKNFHKNFNQNSDKTLVNLKYILIKVFYLIQLSLTLYFWIPKI